MPTPTPRAVGGLADLTRPLPACMRAPPCLPSVVGAGYRDRQWHEQASWEEHGTFKETMRLSEGRPDFTFYDGPPFATGLPHYGHILAGVFIVFVLFFCGSYRKGFDRVWSALRYS